MELVLNSADLFHHCRWVSVRGAADTLLPAAKLLAFVRLG
jgi:hypothetical protein